MSAIDVNLLKAQSFEQPGDLNGSVPAFAGLQCLFIAIIVNCRYYSSLAERHEIELKVRQERAAFLLLTIQKLSNRVEDREQSVEGSEDQLAACSQRISRVLQDLKV